MIFPFPSSTAPSGPGRTRPCPELTQCFSQVSYWFVNARKRIWQPLLHEKHTGSLTGYAKVTASELPLSRKGLLSAPKILPAATSVPGPKAAAGSAKARGSGAQVGPLGPSSAFSASSAAAVLAAATAVAANAAAAAAKKACIQEASEMSASAASHKTWAEAAGGLPHTATAAAREQTRRVPVPPSRAAVDHSTGSGRAILCRRQGLSGRQAPSGALWREWRRRAHPSPREHPRPLLPGNPTLALQPAARAVATRAGRAAA